MLSVHQRYRQTDGQTGGRTIYDSNTALALRASRGNKNETTGIRIREFNSDEMSNYLVG